MDLKNKVAIITGAGSGIGEETALELAKHGCICVLVGRTESKLKRVLEEVQKFTPSSTIELCDVSQPAQVKQMIQAVHERHKNIDILVNNAGIMIVKFFDELSEEEFNSQMDTNFYGGVNLIRAVVPIMQKKGKGVIINVTSVGGKLIVPGTTAYSASKAALLGFSESLHYELKDKGIHVGIVLPASIRTDILDASVNKLGVYYRDQCKTPPIKAAKKIREAIEKENFQTIVPFSYKLLIEFHDFFPGLFSRQLLGRMRPYFK